MKELLSFYLVIINILCFLLMFVDKTKAIKHQWRISEKILMLCALFGGSIGSLLGMRVFHHKTKHPKFYIGIPIILFFQLIIAYYIYIGI